ncbi:UV-endonuclease UvdE-domain-containing protein [Xylariaceae sp. FL0255]|nr:UV-endonuclease UvdE-domain-containing protein [Xylariaceae sp. FL0255]
MCGTPCLLIRSCTVVVKSRGLFSPAYRHHYSSLPLSRNLYIPFAAHPPFVTVTTMVSKRKQSDMALMSPSVVVEDHSTLSHPSKGPRRSGRLLDKPGQGLKEDMDEVDVLTDASGDSTRGKRGRHVKRKSGVTVVMDGLREMEDQLQNAVKRQKLAIQESMRSSKSNLDLESAVFTPRANKSSVATVAEATKEKKAKKKAGKEAEQDPEPKGIKEEEDVKMGERPAKRGEDGDYVPEEIPEENNVNTLKLEAARPPPVNSDYLPLPWKGRLGYACLNTYLRQSNPPVFSSRTCRIASILEHRHPLADPSQPEHPTKNRPDKDQPADVARGQKYVEGLGLANARDIVKMIRWNDKYGIKFMRLSSEMFPFASHEEYGYKLAPFAADTLAEAGKVAGELGHRLTTHPGQFTQLGSPRAEVVRNAVRDLEYHNEMLRLFKLPDQQNKDAVMILHMGGVFGDKEATLDRFRLNYAKLSDPIKARLVLENDDVSWTVHDLLPICEELNIPLVLDFHHHNIMFDETQIREGTKDIMELYPRIKATWDRKGITQKMHYSEPCSEAVTRRQRRKHRPRVMTLPPCPDTMDLMIEAKDKEQAVFDLMRTFRLPGWETFNDVIPYERADENRPAPRVAAKKTSRKKKAKDEDDEDDKDEQEKEAKAPPEVPEAEIGMGGPENRVYWPLGMEEWLRPKKREVKKKAKGDEENKDEQEEGLPTLDF